LTDRSFRWNSPWLLVARDVSPDAATVRRDDQHVAAGERWLADQRAVVRAPQFGSPRGLAPGDLLAVPVTA
jgi:hypothetical protein